MHGQQDTETVNLIPNNPIFTLSTSQKSSKNLNFMKKNY